MGEVRVQESLVGLLFVALWGGFRALVGDADLHPSPCFAPTALHGRGRQDDPFRIYLSAFVKYSVGCCIV